MDFSSQHITEQINVFSSLTQIEDEAYSHALLATFDYDVNKAVDFYFQEDITRSSPDDHLENPITLDIHVVGFNGKSFKKIVFYLPKETSLLEVKRKVYDIERDSFHSVYSSDHDFDFYKTKINFVNAKLNDSMTLDSLTKSQRLFISLSYRDPSDSSIQGPKCRFIVNKESNSVDIDLGLEQPLEDVRLKVRDFHKIPLSRQEYEIDGPDEGNAMMDLIVQTLNSLKNERQANSNLRDLGIMQDDIFVLKVKEHSSFSSSLVNLSNHHTIQDILQDENLMNANPLNDSNVSINVDLDESRDEIDIEEDDFHVYSDEDEDNFNMKNNEGQEISNNLLIPDTGSLLNISELTGTFVTNFALRYCKEDAELLPPFWSVDIEEAIDGTIANRDITLRKPLFLYIHNDKSIAVHIFVSKLMCSPELRKFFDQNKFVIWPFDISTARLKDTLLNKILKFRVPLLHHHIKDLRPDQYPLLIMLSKVDSNIEVLACIQSDGKITRKLSNPLLDPDHSLFPLPSELVDTLRAGSSSSSDNDDGVFEPDRILAKLLDAYLQYQDRMEPVIGEYKRRIERENLRKIQEAEFLESLERDKLKMLAKKEEEELNRRRQMLLDLQKERADNEAKERREKNLSELPEEPKTNGSDVITFKLRLPSECSQSVEGAKNGSLFRKFYKTDKASHLIAFIESLGFPTDKYKLITSFPAKDLTEIEDMSQTFIQLNFKSQEALILEER